MPALPPLSLGRSAVNYIPEPGPGGLPAPVLGVAPPPPRPNAPPLTAPNVAPYQPPTPFGYTPAKPGPFTGTAPTATPYGDFAGKPPASTPYGELAAQPSYGDFTGQAPTATPYGNFTAPDPGVLSKAGQFRLDQGQKAIQRGAAARGTLLTGGLQARLLEHGQGVASQEYDNDYRRAMADYETNRGTNAQNYGQSLEGYRANLAGYTANRDTNAQNFGQTLARYGANRDTNAQNFGQDMAGYQAGLDGYRTNRDTNTLNVNQQRDAYRDLLDAYKTNADVTFTGNGQDFAAATAGYDRNAAAGRTAYQDATADTLRRSDVDAANAANTYQAQLDEYARQQQAQRDAIAAGKRTGSMRRGGAVA